MAHWEKRLAKSNPLREGPKSLVAPVESTARCCTSSRPPLECSFVSLQEPSVGFSSGRPFVDLRCVALYPA
jgi:hypothetical protein